MRLYIIRHGQKANIDPDYDDGWNAPLTEIGQQQANHLGSYLSECSIDRLYSSSLLRALQTAKFCNARISCDWHVWPIFCESSNNQWPKRYAEEPDQALQLTAWQTGEHIESPSVSELEEYHGHYYLLSTIPDRFPDVELSQPFPWPEAWWIPLRGQTRSMGYVRAELGLHALVEQHEEDDRIALICHGNFGDKLITTLMDFPRRQQPRRFFLDETGIARLDRQYERKWRIEYLNRIDHLPPDLH